MKKDKFMYNSVWYVLLFVSLLFGITSCEKSELETVEEKTENPAFLSVREATKSLADVDTTLNASADDFVYFETYGNERNCGCVPPIKVEIVTGVPVFWFPLGGSHECKKFSLEYTINGITTSREEVNGTDMFVTDVRIGNGQGCKGSVTLKCQSENEDCKPFGDNEFASGRCARTVYFSLKEGEEATSNPHSCGRYYEEVTVKVIQDGSAIVYVPEPSIVDNKMAPTQLDIRHDGRVLGSQELKIGKNEISYTTGIYNYQIRMYNPDLCGGSGPTNHYLECDLLGSPGLRAVREINNHH